MRRHDTAGDVPPIEEGPTPTWEEIQKVPINEVGEHLTPLSLAPEHFLVRPVYHTSGVPGAMPECLARDGVRRRLLVAQGFLPPHLRLVILDAWRGENVQRALMALCSKAMGMIHPEASEEELDDMVRQFVADPDHSYPHLTGGAIDLSVATKDGALLWFGTPYNHPGPLSRTRHFEERLEAGEDLDDQEFEALENRRILHAAMTGAGFVNYPGQWWHYEYGTRRWAMMVGRKHAVYGALRPRLNPFETYARA